MAEIVVDAGRDAYIQVGGVVSRNFKEEDKLQWAENYNCYGYFLGMF